MTWTYRFSFQANHYRKYQPKHTWKLIKTLTARSSLVKNHGNSIEFPFGNLFSPYCIMHIHFKRYHKCPYYILYIVLLHNTSQNTNTYLNNILWALMLSNPLFLADSVGDPAPRYQTNCVTHFYTRIKNEKFRSMLIVSVILKSINLFFCVIL